jgi:hypothetical protein
MIVPAADLRSHHRKQPADRNGSATFMQLDPYKVNMEHRVMDQAAPFMKRSGAFLRSRWRGYAGDWRENWWMKNAPTTRTLVERQSPVA